MTRRMTPLTVSHYIGKRWGWRQAWSKKEVHIMVPPSAASILPGSLGFNLVSGIMDVWFWVLWSFKLYRWSTHLLVVLSVCCKPMLGRLYCRSDYCNVDLHPIILAMSFIKTFMEVKVRDWEWMLNFCVAADMESAGWSWKKMIMIPIPPSSLPALHGQQV